MRIGILAYPGCLGTQLFGVADVLHMAHQIAVSMGIKASRCEVEVIGLGRRTVAVGGGVAVSVRRPSGKYDVLLVPGLEIHHQADWDERLAPLARELALIGKVFASGTTVAACCVGAFLLGESGLLAGRKATTSWLFARELGQRYQGARVNPTAMLVDDGGVITTGAVSAVFDLAIHLAKRIYGARVATATANAALLPAQRATQAPYVDPALGTPTLPPFSRSLAQWFGERLQQPYDLERVALAFHVSTRTLLRRVKAETGDSPLALLQQARVERAKTLLTTTSKSIARITEEVGYADPATFARLFARHAGTTPARHRRSSIGAG